MNLDMLKGFLFSQMLQRIALSIKGLLKHAKQQRTEGQSLQTSPVPQATVKWPVVLNWLGGVRRKPDPQESLVVVSSSKRWLREQNTPQRNVLSPLQDILSRLLMEQTLTCSIKSPSNTH